MSGSPEVQSKAGKKNAKRHAARRAKKSAENTTNDEENPTTNHNADEVDDSTVEALPAQPEIPLAPSRTQEPLSIDDQIADTRRQRSEAKATNDHVRVNVLSRKLWALMDKEQLGTAGPSAHEKSNAVLPPAPPQPPVAKSVEEQKYSLTDTEKRLRNLKKKLRTIEDLKAKREAGSKLEDTQLAKIANEKEITDEVREIEELLATTGQK